MRHRPTSSTTRTKRRRSQSRAAGTKTTRLVRATRWHSLHGLAFAGSCELSSAVGRATSTSKLHTNSVVFMGGRKSPFLARPEWSCILVCAYDVVLEALAEEYFGGMQEDRFSFRFQATKRLTTKFPLGGGVSDRTLSSEAGAAGRRAQQEVETLDQGVAELTARRASNGRPRRDRWR